MNDNDNIELMQIALALERGIDRDRVKYRPQPVLPETETPLGYPIIVSDEIPEGAVVAIQFSPPLEFRPDRITILGPGGAMAEGDIEWDGCRGRVVWEKEGDDA